MTTGIDLFGRRCEKISINPDHFCIFCCAVNGSRAEELKRERPLEMRSDIAIVYYLEKKTERCSVVTPITYSLMKGLDLTEEELKWLAWENTIRQKHPLRAPLHELLDKEEEMKALYVLSNEEMYLGAVVIFYPGVLAKIARELDSDLLILPSSIHECLILPERDDIDAEKLRLTVCSVNDTEVDEEEILSYNVYRYSRKEDTVLIDNS